MNYTPVHNRFWSDGWVRQLNALDRYLFLYLLTNGRAHPTGVYELPLDLMAAESGIDEKDLRMSMLQRLEPKIYYKEGWVILINYPTHRVSNSPKLITGILNSFGEIPRKIQELALSYGYPIDTLSIHIPVSRNRIEENKREEKRISAPRVEEYITEKEMEEGAREYENPASVLDDATDEWKPINPEDYRKWKRSNKTERKTIDQWISEEGREQYSKWVVAVEIANQRPYIQPYTKPSQAYKDRAKIRTFLQKEQVKQVTSKPKGRGFA